MTAPERWIHTWTASVQATGPGDRPPPPFTGLAGTTLRQTLRLTAGGPRLRVRFSNAFGGAALPITAASVATPAGGWAGVASIAPGSVRPLTFGGRPGVVVPAGAQVVSDPVAMPVGPGSNLSVSVYLAVGQAGPDLTAHPGSRTTSYLVKGDHTREVDLPGAVGVDHWYLVSGIEVVSGATALAIVGDSLTDGRGSTTNGNDRWPDRLSARHPRAAVLNQGAGGNRVLDDDPEEARVLRAVRRTRRRRQHSTGVLSRLDRDVAGVGADRLLLFAGVNDIGTAAATPAGQSRLVEELLQGYEQVVLRAHAWGIPVYAGTLTPFGGHLGYDDPGGLRERSRRTVNDALPDIFDGVADFDAAVRDPGRPGRLCPSFDTGDHLHLNPPGYEALAAAVPPEWL